nr:C-GCAxxG-C-C family protein [uncultured Marinifilum sp.]
MSFFNKKSKADKALKYFRQAPAYHNCAQTIYKIFQDEYGITNDQISELSKHGNGKAPDGLCGAYFAGLELLKNNPELREEFSKRFKERSQYLTCFDIRLNYSMSCKNLVFLTANLLEELTNEQKKKNE